MHCIRIVYPKKPGSSFNWEHYYDVHLPLGLSLLAKHCGIAPERVEVDQGITADGVDDNVPYHCICSLYFTSREHVAAMVGLFGIEEARQQLADDWPKYTEMDPELLVTEVVEAEPGTGRPILNAA